MTGGFAMNSTTCNQRHTNMLQVRANFALAMLANAAAQKTKFQLPKLGTNALQPIAAIRFC